MNTLCVCVCVNGPVMSVAFYGFKLHLIEMSKLALRETRAYAV